MYELNEVVGLPCVLGKAEFVSCILFFMWSLSNVDYCFA